MTESPVYKWAPHLSTSSPEPRPRTTQVQVGKLALGSVTTSPIPILYVGWLVGGFGLSVGVGSGSSSGGWFSVGVGSGSSSGGWLLGGVKSGGVPVGLGTQ